MPPSRAPYALGISDFRLLREGGFAYLTVVEIREADGELEARLAVPNREVAGELRRMLRARGAAPIHELAVAFDRS